MQVVQYVHRSGEGLPDHAMVTEISQSTAEAVRAQLHSNIDSLVNDIASGWLPPTVSATEAKAAADANVKQAEAALADAKAAQAEAAKAVETEAAEAKAASDATSAKAAAAKK